MAPEVLLYYALIMSLHLRSFTLMEMARLAIYSPNYRSNNNENNNNIFLFLLNLGFMDFHVKI